MESQPPILTDVTEALDEYLKLKLKYQEQLNKNKKKITSNTNAIAGTTRTVQVYRFVTK